MAALQTLSFAALLLIFPDVLLILYSRLGSKTARFKADISLNLGYLASFAVVFKNKFNQTTYGYYPKKLYSRFTIC